MKLVILTDHTHFLLLSKSFGFHLVRELHVTIAVFQFMMFFEELACKISKAVPSFTFTPFVSSPQLFVETGRAALQN